MAWGDSSWIKKFDFLRLRKQSYQLALTSPAGQRVLADLACFCRASESVYHSTTRGTDILIGRHEVWLRIVNHLRLSDEQLMALYDGQGFNTKEEA